MRIIFEQLLAEILSLPGLALLLLSLAVVAVRYRAAKRGLNDIPDATANVPPAPAPVQTPLPNRSKTRIFLAALMLSGLLLATISVFQSHFSLSNSMIAKLIIGTISYAIISVALLRSKSAIKQAISDVVLIGNSVLLLAAGSIIVQVFSVGIGLGPLKFLLYLIISLLGDFLLQIRKPRTPIRSYRPGKHFAPAAVTLLILILSGSDRVWLVSPFELIMRAYRLLPVFFLIIILPYLMIAFGRFLSPGRNLYWNIMRYLLSFEVALCAIGISVSVVHRMEVGVCSAISEDEHLGVMGYQTNLLSDAMIVGPGEILASMKEGKSVDRFLLDDDERIRIRFSWSPERITFDPQSQLIYSIHVDQADAPIALLNNEPLEISRLIKLSDCPKSYWSIEEPGHHRLWVLCNSRSKNIYALDTLTGDLIAEFSDDQRYGEYFYGAIDEQAHRLWTVNLYYGIAREFEIIDEPTLDLRPLRTMRGFTSLVQDVALDYEAGLMFVSRNLQLRPFPFGGVYAYRLDNLELAWDIPIYSARYMALDKKSGILYVLSLADGGLHIIDYKKGELKKSIFVGQQVRSVRVDERSGAVIIASKCGAVVYLPDEAMTGDNLQFLEKMRKFRGGKKHWRPVK